MNEVTDAEDNPLAAATEMLTEARLLRQRQEERLESIRTRSVTLLSALAAGLVVAAGFSDDPQVALLTASGFAAAVAMYAAVEVHRPRDGWLAGPGIQDLDKNQYASAAPVADVRRALALYHDCHYRENECGVARKVSDRFTLQIVASGVSVALAMVAVAI